MLEWLGLGSTVFLQGGTESANAYAGKAFSANGSVLIITASILFLTDIGYTSEPQFRKLHSIPPKNLICIVLI